MLSSCRGARKRSLMALVIAHTRGGQVQCRVVCGCHCLRPAPSSVLRKEKENLKAESLATAMVVNGTANIRIGSNRCPSAWELEMTAAHSRDRRGHNPRLRPDFSRFAVPRLHLHLGFGPPERVRTLLCFFENHRPIPGPQSRLALQQQGDSVRRSAALHRTIAATKEAAAACDVLKLGVALLRNLSQVT